VVVVAVVVVVGAVIESRRSAMSGTSVFEESFGVGGPPAGLRSGGKVEEL